jgi:hypothetical protein
MHLHTPGAIGGVLNLSSGTYMSATNSAAIRFSAAFQTDFRHEFDALAPDVDFRLPIENTGGSGNPDPDPDPGSGSGYSIDTPPTPPSPPPEPSVDNRETIEAYSLEFFEQQGIRHGGNNGVITRDHYLRDIARGYPGAQYFRRFRGIEGGTILYAHALKIDDLQMMDFWGWVERDTSQRTDAAVAHYEQAKQVYWEAYYKEWKIRFPQWDTREPLPPLIPPDGAGGSGGGNLPSYLTRLRALLVALASELEDEPRAELLGQMDALLAAGDWVDAGKQYHLMSTFSRIYVVANYIWFERDLPEAVQMLKWKLGRSASVRAFFFPDKVLAALSMVPAIKELFQGNNHDYDVIRELVALAATYAEFNPQNLEPQTPLQCWFYQLWRAQTASEMREGLVALETWLQPVPMPMEILGFAHDLLRVVPQTLGGDARSLKEIVGLGKAYGVLDPLCAEGLRGGSFLDTLWSVAQMRRYRPDLDLEFSGRDLGAQQLQESLAGRRSPIPVIRLTRRVLEAVKRSALPIELQQSRRVLHDLVGLSWTYGSLTPTRLTVAEARREGFFLDTLWRSAGEEAISQAAPQIVEFVAESTNPARLFEFSRRLIKVAKHTPATRRKQKTASFLKALVYLGREYGLLEPIEAENDEGKAVDLFLHTVWTAQSQENVKKGVKQFEVFSGQIKDHTKLLNFSRGLIHTAKVTRELGQEVREAYFLSELLGLGWVYAALDPSLKEKERDPKFFLNTLWQMKTNLSQAEKLRAIIKSSSEFRDLVVEQVEPSKRLKLIDMERNLLEIFKDSSELTSHKGDAKFLKELTDLAKAHSVLSLPKDPGSGNSSKFFIDILWQDEVNGKKNGNDQLREALIRIWGDSIDAETFQRSFEFATRLFVASKGGSSAFSELPNGANYDPYGLLFEPLAKLAYAYATLDPIKSDPASSTLFLDTLWSIENNIITPDFLAGVDRGNQQMQEFLSYFEAKDQPEIVTFISNVLTAFQLAPNLREELHQPSWVEEVINSALWYLFVDSAVDGEDEIDALNFLFSKIWETQERAKLGGLVNDVQSSIINTGSAAAFSIASLILGSFTVSPPVAPPPITTPPPPLPPGSRMPLGLVLLIAVMVFAKVLDAGETIQPWNDLINPFTEDRYTSEEEYRLVQALTPEQVEFLKELTPEQVKELNRLPRNINYLQEDLLELDPDATSADDEQRRCIVGEVPRTSGNSDVIRHNAYADHITGAEMDYFVVEPKGQGLTYDGRKPETRTLFEVKAPRRDESGSWLNQALSDPNGYRGKRALKSIASLTEQKEKQQRVATMCRFSYRYVVSSRGMAKFLQTRWGKSIKVEYIPNPNP